MFTAKLIENTSFYRSQRTLFYLSLVSAFPLFVSYVFNDIPLWAGAALIVACGALIWPIVRHGKRIKEAHGKRQIQLTDAAITVKSLVKPAEREYFPLTDLREIEVETTRGYGDFDLQSAASGTENSRTIILHPGTAAPKRFDFFVDSHYQAKQFAKLLAGWKERGLPVVPLRTSKV